MLFQIKLINERLKKNDCLRRGYILEGFPENRTQAFGLQSLGVMPQHVGKLLLLYNMLSYIKNYPTHPVTYPLYFYK